MTGPTVTRAVPWRELDSRTGDAGRLRVELWARPEGPAGGDLEVRVWDDSVGADFVLAPVDGRDALDAFGHPFAYVAAHPERVVR